MSMSIKELNDKINAEIAKLGVDTRELKQRVAVRWFPRLGAMEASFRLQDEEQTLMQILRDDTVTAPDKQKAQNAYLARRSDILDQTSPTVIQRFSKFPLNPAMLVVAIFDHETSWSVYALPDNSDPNAKTRFPTCYELSKVSSTFDASAMTLNTFIQEIADEWSAVDGDVSSRERERAAVVDFLNSLPDDYAVKQAAQDIATDLHVPLGEDEEEIEEEIEEETEQPVDAAPAPAEATQPSTV